MRAIYALSVVVLTIGSSAQAKDGFDLVHCDKDIPQTLRGTHVAYGTVVEIEARHKDIGLKDTGADEISDDLSSISWRMCGAEYMMLLDRRDLVRDVLEVPPHSHRTPEFVDGTCQRNGKEAPELVVAILDNPRALSSHDASTGKTLLAATSAWKIDEKNARFVKISTDGLRCSLGGVITLDGGP